MIAMGGSGDLHINIMNDSAGERNELDLEQDSDNSVSDEKASVVSIDDITSEHLEEEESSSDSSM